MKKDKKKEKLDLEIQMKMESVKRKREAIDLVQSEFIFFQRLTSKALEVLDA